MTAGAFVAGATGFVGRALIQALVARGVPTRAHVRPDSRQLTEWRTRFEAMGAIVDTTAWEPAAMTAALRAHAPTHVWNVIGTTRKRAAADRVAGDIYQAVDVGLTKILVAAAVASGARPRVVQLSSIGASTKARSAYLRARGQADAVVMASGLPWAIARPSFIVGDGRDDKRTLEDASAAVANAMLGVAGFLGARTLRATYRSIDPATLAAALARLGLDDDRDLIATGPDLRSA
ncbi:MAG: NAD(P)H-binding protein [Myxococcales bacterium]|nr:NAD(P)H-binding protein [Myxococcales bacterium]